MARWSPLGDSGANSGDRLIATAHSLRHADDVRFDGIGLRTEPVASAAETADHFVDDQQDVVLAAYLLDAHPIAGRRRNNAACPHHRFANKGGHVLCADLKDLGLDGIGGISTIKRIVLITPSLPCVGAVGMNHARYWQAGDIVHRRQAAKAGPCHGRSVIGIFATYYDLPLRASLRGPVAAYKTQGGIVCLRP